MTDSTEVNHGHVEISGAPLYYEIKGTGPAIVLLHEGIADCRMYDDQFASLAEHFRVLRYDLPGFGRSGWPDRPYTQHQALRDLLAHLDIERAALLGMSMGGGIALDFALTHPTMVDALLLFAAGVAGRPPSDRLLALAAPLMDAFKAGDFVLAIDLTVRFWVDGPTRGPDEVNPLVRERVRAMYTEVLRRTREGGRPADPLEPSANGRLGEIDVPTLVVVGSGDLPDIHETAAFLEMGIQGARRVVLPNVAHVFNLELPEETNQLILDFLTELHLRSG